MPIKKVEYDAFCDDMEQMLVGLGDENRIGYNQYTSGGNDYIRNVPSSVFGNAIYNAFQPLATSTRTRMWTIVEFNITGSPENNILLTHEGREEAYNTLPERISSIILNQKGRYGKHISSLTQNTDLSEEDIQNAVQSKIDEYQVQFSQAGDYASKNTVLLEMRKFYDEVRDESQLSALVTAYKVHELQTDNADSNVASAQDDAAASKAFREETQTIRDAIKQAPAAVKAAKEAWQQAQSSGKTLIESDKASNEAGQQVLSDMTASRDFRAKHKEAIAAIKGNAPADQAAKQAWQQARSSGSTLLQSDEAASKAGEDVINENRSGGPGTP